MALPPAATRMQTPWSCKGAPACTVDNQESALSSPSDSPDRQRCLAEPEVRCDTTAGSGRSGIA